MSILLDNRSEIINDILAERDRQDELCAAGRFVHTLAEPGALTACEKLAVVAEEFGEVSHIVADAIAWDLLDTEHLREELVQLAACCVAWLEAIDQECVTQTDLNRSARCCADAELAALVSEHVPVT